MAEPPTPPPAAEGDPDFEERLRRFVVKELREFGAGAAASDLAGEVMVRYVRDRPARYVPWLRRTLRTVAIDHWRRGTITLEGRRVPVGLQGLPPTSFVSDPAGGGPPVPLPAALLASSLSTPEANRDVARRLMAALTPAQRPVVFARYWEDLTSAEIAALLGYRGAAVVDTILDRAERRLRQRFPGGIDAVH